MAICRYSDSTVLVPNAVLNTKRNSTFPMSGRTLGRLGLIVGLALLAAQNCSAEDRKTCYTISGTSKVATGDMLRLALLAATAAAHVPDQPLTPSAPPVDAKRCTGTNAAIPAAGPTNMNYYGGVDNKAKFRRFAMNGCTSDQYFSIGKAIYFRNCSGGAGNGYIYFWGKPDGNASTCFGSTYPAMFAEANKTKGAPVTAAKMASVYSGGLIGDDQSAYALGNMMAAMLIAEASRDYLVIPINYMLVDQAIAGKLTPEQVAGGHCPPSARVCGNPQAKGDGAHPLAWGGALDSMMTGGGWGTNNGATSDYGMNLETSITVNWLKNKKAISTANPSTCPVGMSYKNLGTDDATRLKALFKDLF